MSVTAPKKQTRATPSPDVPSQSTATAETQQLANLLGYDAERLTLLAELARVRRDSFGAIRPNTPLNLVRLLLTRFGQQLGVLPLEQPLPRRAAPPAAESQATPGDQNTLETLARRRSLQVQHHRPQEVTFVPTPDQAAIQQARLKMAQTEPPEAPQPDAPQPDPRQRDIEARARMANREPTTWTPSPNTLNTADQLEAARRRAIGAPNP